MVILSCISKYTIPHIVSFVESIEKCGFLGKKVMLVYDDVPKETSDYLISKGWEVHFEQLWYRHVPVQRFRDLYRILSKKYYDETIIFTDAKDIVFQKDPTEWIENNMKKEIIAFSECVRYKDESWAVNNASTSFPLEWEWLKEKTSYCAGVIVGKSDSMKDLFLSIFRWSMNTLNPIEAADQVSFNILINLNNFKKNVQLVNQEEGFVTHLGTVWMKKTEQPLLEPTPIFKNDKFYNNNGEEFVIVHQYDRDPLIKNIIRNKYK